MLSHRTRPAQLVLTPLFCAACGSSSSSGSSLQGAGAAPLHLAQPTIYSCGGGSLATGDFNGDGHLDVVAGGPSGDGCAMFGHGDGTFGDPVNFTTGAGDDESIVQVYDAKQALSTPVAVASSSGSGVNHFSLGDVDCDSGGFLLRG